MFPGVGHDNEMVSIGWSGQELVLGQRLGILGNRDRRGFMRPGRSGNRQSGPGKKQCEPKLCVTHGTLPCSLRTAPEAF